MRVVMLTSVAGKPGYRGGDVYDLDDRIAKVWIAEGMAKPAPDEKSKA